MQRSTSVHSKQLWDQSFDHSYELTGRWPEFTSNWSYCLTQAGKDAGFVFFLWKRALYSTHDPIFWKCVLQILDPIFPVSLRYLQAALFVLGRPDICAFKCEGLCGSSYLSRCTNRAVLIKPQVFWREMFIILSVKWEAQKFSTSPTGI